LGVAFARQTLLRIHERSGGNPFVALEIARALPDALDPLEPLPVPDTLEELVRARLAALPARTRRGLAIAAALGTPSEALLRRTGVSASVLDPAVSAQVVEREHGLVRFTHPLLSSVLYASLGAERRRIHARIAKVVDDPVLRARHVALSTEAPDDDTARLLDEAVEKAGTRGAPSVSAELAELAMRLTPAHRRDERIRRAVVAARAHLEAGEWTRAQVIVSGLIAEVPYGPLRAECLLLLAEFEHDDLAVPVLNEALSHAATNPRLSARIRIRLGWAQRFREGFPAAIEAVRTGLQLAERAQDDSLRFEALTTLHTLGARAGDPATDAYAECARAIAAATGDEAQVRQADLLASGTSLDPAGSEAERTKLEAAYRAWRERDELFTADVLGELSWAELAAGRWALAAEHAARAREIKVQYGVEQNQDYIPIAWIAAHRGELESALEESARALKLCDEQIGFHPPLLKAVPGLVALVRGDPAAAVRHLAEADSRAHALGWAAPDARPWSADYVEALVQVDRIDEASRVIDDWEADVARVGRSGVPPAVIRSRGLVAAAQGSVHDAIRLLEEAAAGHAAVRDTFGRGRALLALGIVLRRARQRRAAREALGAAEAAFEALGAAAWLHRARAELGRIGGHALAAGLTPAERRVAALVAEGRTNHEVAAALFLTERTVASHLTHVYAKVGVRSRTELARKIQTF
jgi:DNA-binding CsgD family transcriptional regulator